MGDTRYACARKIHPHLSETPCQWPSRCQSERSRLLSGPARNNRQAAAPAPSHAGKLQKIVYPNGTNIEYTYDTLGRVKTLTSRATSNGTPYTTTYTYDPNGNVHTVLDPFGGLTTYTYDARDRLQTRTLPNGVLTTWTFDNRDRMTKIEHKDTVTNAIITSFEYVRPTNAVGEPHRMIRRDGASSISYINLAYDPALRLQREEYFNGDRTPVICCSRSPTTLRCSPRRTRSPHKSETPVQITACR